MKKAVFAGVLLGMAASVSIAQNDPTIDAMYFSDTDPFCPDGPDKIFTVVVTDTDGDVMYCNPPIALNGYLDFFTGPPPVTVGNTTTFEFEVAYNYDVPPAPGTQALEDISVTAYNFSGADPAGNVSDTYTGVNVSGSVQVDFTVPFLELCSAGNPVNLNEYVVTPGGTFNYPTTPFFSEYSQSTAFNLPVAYQVYINNDYSYYINYELADPNGCIGTGNLSVSFNDVPQVTATVTPNTCTGATGQASVDISGNAPFNVYWSNGFNETTSFTSGITNLSSGVYYANVTDSYGCKSVAKANVSDSDIIVTDVVTPARCAGQPGSVDLDITPTTGTVTSVYWSNGHTTPILSSGPGEYSVEVHTSANCNYFGTYVIPDSILKVKLEDVYDNSNCVSPNGAIYIQTIGGNGPYTWDWKKNGVSVYTTEDITPIDGGVYTCTVVDNNGCSLTWGKTVANYNSVYLWVDNVVKPTCGNSTGSIDMYVDPFGDTPADYTWSTGATSEDLSGLSNGNYTLTYTDQAGCTSYLTIKLENEKPYQPSICLLTVDTSLIYNQVVWEKDISQNIEGFHVYRETSVLGTFEKVATRPYALESFYQDNDASPVDRSWRYYITSYDACGGESYGSFVHKTIHVVANTSDGVDYDLSWDDYEGIAYSTIDLFRYDDVNGWTTVANLPYGTNTYGDTPPVIAGLDYMVSFNLSDPLYINQSTGP